MSLDQIIEKAADLTLQTFHKIVLSAFLPSKQLAKQLTKQLAKQLAEQLSEQQLACKVFILFWISPSVDGSAALLIRLLSSTISNMCMKCWKKHK